MLSSSEWKNDVAMNDSGFNIKNTKCKKLLGIKVNRGRWCH